MKKYNYFYNQQAIPESQFLSAVPKDWENDVIAGESSWGYYRAIEREENTHKQQSNGVLPLTKE